MEEWQSQQVLCRKEQIALLTLSRSSTAAAMSGSQWLLRWQKGTAGNPPLLLFAVLLLLLCSLCGSGAAHSGKEHSIGRTGHRILQQSRSSFLCPFFFRGTTTTGNRHNWARGRPATGQSSPTAPSFLPSTDLLPPISAVPIRVVRRCTGWAGRR